jgi:hypothetical protein
MEGEHIRGHEISYCCCAFERVTTGEHMYCTCSAACTGVGHGDTHRPCRQTTSRVADFGHRCIHIHTQMHTYTYTHMHTDVL